MIVALTGATGIVGRFVAERLAREGVSVRALVRSSSDRRELPADTVYVVGDITDSRTLQQLVAGADGVVHCAYGHVPGRYRGGEGDDLPGFWRTNLLGGVELMQRAYAAGVSRLVVMSSRAVFGEASPGGAWVNDNTRAVPDTHYGALKLTLEAHASAFAASGACFSSLRPTGVYGVTHPVERSKWFDLVARIRQGDALPEARLATEVHGRDVAAAVWLLLTSPAEQVAGRAFNCSDLVVDTRDVMARLASHLGVRPTLPPPASNEVRNAMRTPALHALGWRPGGDGLLDRTLGELAAAT